MISAVTQATDSRPWPLEVVKASPDKVATHDRQGWLDLFSSTATVEDPVGSAPVVRGQGEAGTPADPLGRFYDTFIASNAIRFDVTRDIVEDKEVVRDVTIHTTTSAGVEVLVPAHLHYELKEENGQLKIDHLAAHWELGKVTRDTLLGGGLRGVWSMLQMSWRMLSIQGFGGVLGYLRAMFTGIFAKGHGAVEELSRALAAGDSARVQALFVDDSPRIQLTSDGAPIRPSELNAKLCGGEAAQVRATKVISAGWFTTCDLEVDRQAKGSEIVRSVAFFEFDPSTRRISSARLFGR